MACLGGLTSTPRSIQAMCEGRIELVTGPMFSGKSTELCRRVRRFQFAHKRCLLIKYAKDTRYSEDCVSTHDKVMLPAISCDELRQASASVADVDVVGIDEGQFFPDLVAFCIDLMHKGKVVVVAALDGTFAAKPFGGVCDMVPKCVLVHKLAAVCSTCGAPAGFSKRLSADTAVELIGGTDTYSPMCRGCYFGLPHKAVTTASTTSASQITTVQKDACADEGKECDAVPQRHGGSIELVMGPMFSGKSTELLRRIRLARFAKKACLLIKYKRDTRYSDDCVSTHDRVMQKAVSCDTLMQVLEATAAFDVVGVDEGQFFPDLLKFCNIVANQGKTVIVAALDGTFAAEPFGDVCNLIPYCTRVHKLAAVCAVCGEDAAFSKRLSNETAVEVIGGAESYSPMCCSCFYGDAGHRSLRRRVARSSSSFSSTRSPSPASDDAQSPPLDGQRALSPPSPVAPSPETSLEGVRKKLFVEAPAATAAVAPTAPTAHANAETLFLRAAVLILGLLVVAQWAFATSPAALEL